MAAHNGVQHEPITNGGGEKLGDNFSHEDREATLSRMRTAGSISLSPEMFERLYLSPQNAVKGELRKTFGNPTPVAIAGFLLCLTPLSAVLMGWRGSGGLGASGTGSYFYFGGVLMLLGGVGEWLLGNTFPTIVFMTFGAFWFTFGATLVPYYAAYAAFAEDPVTAPQEGLASPVFAASFAFFLLFMGMLCFVFLLASVRTNVIFFLIFLLLVPTFGLLAGAFWNNALGKLDAGMNCQKAGGALAFVISMLGWYLFTALVLLSVDFPFDLPLGDLSTVIKGKSDRAKNATARNEGELQ